MSDTPSAPRDNFYGDLAVFAAVAASINSAVLYRDGQLGAAQMQVIHNLLHRLETSTDRPDFHSIVQQLRQILPPDPMPDPQSGR